MNLIEVGCAVIEQDGKILVSQRAQNDSFGGLWEFPGGKRETGETLEACLVREIQEELGGTIRPRKFLFKRREIFPTREIDLHFYVCDWLGGIPVAHDAERVEWVEIHRLPEYPFIPADLEVIQDLIQKQVEYFERPEQV